MARIKKKIVGTGSKEPFRFCSHKTPPNKKYGTKFLTGKVIYLKVRDTGYPNRT